MKYRHVAGAFFNSPWAILPEKLAEIQLFVERAVAGDLSVIAFEGRLNEEAKARLRTGWEARCGPPAADDVPPVALAARDRRGVQMAGRVACVQVFGTLTQRANLLTDFSGGTSTEQLGQTLDGLAADKAVRSICLVVDSPGGSVFGVPELADKVRGLRADKKVVAVADSLAASAAYWVASQAGELYCTPGGLVGSVGVIAAHCDESRLEELAGVKTSLVSAGRYKAELDPSLPLSPEARDALQAQVDQYYGMFVAAVAKGRGVGEGKVKSDFGQGRCLTAADAKAAGMIDGVATLETVLRRLGADPRSGAGASARLAALRARAAAAE